MAGSTRTSETVRSGRSAIAETKLGGYDDAGADRVLADLGNPGGHRAWQPSNEAARCGLSVRALERAFQEWMRTTPAKHHSHLRLERSRELIRLSNLPMLEIALRCGFNSAAHFSDSYEEFFGHPPSADRGRTRIVQPGR